MNQEWFVKLLTLCAIVQVGCLTFLYLHLTYTKLFC
jgi:hypothetical protein